MKLQIFRRFYIMVIIYIYFTRVAVYLLQATIPFYLLWLGPLAHETATLIFFCITGYQFQPAIDNPYLSVKTEEHEGQEYGLTDDGDEELFIGNHNNHNNNHHSHLELQQKSSHGHSSNNSNSK
jgi:hypothetical protein